MRFNVLFSENFKKKKNKNLSQIIHLRLFISDYWSQIIDEPKTETGFETKHHFLIDSNIKALVEADLLL